MTSLGDGGGNGGGDPVGCCVCDALLDPPVLPVAEHPRLDRLHICLRCEEHLGPSGPDGGVIPRSDEGTADAADDLCTVCAGSPSLFVCDGCPTFCAPCLLRLGVFKKDVKRRFPSTTGAAPSATRRPSPPQRRPSSVSNASFQYPAVNEGGGGGGSSPRSDDLAAASTSSSSSSSSASPPSSSPTAEVEALQEALVAALEQVEHAVTETIDALDDDKTCREKHAQIWAEVFERGWPFIARAHAAIAPPMASAAAFDADAAYDLRLVAGAPEIGAAASESAESASEDDGREAALRAAARDEDVAWRGMWRERLEHLTVHQQQLQARLEEAGVRPEFFYRELFKQRDEDSDDDSEEDDEEDGDEDEDSDGGDYDRMDVASSSSSSPIRSRSSRFGAARRRSDGNSTRRRAARERERKARDKAGRAIAERERKNPDLDRYDLSRIAELGKEEWDRRRAVDSLADLAAYYKEKEKQKEKKQRNKEEDNEDEEDEAGEAPVEEIQGTLTCRKTDSLEVERAENAEREAIARAARSGSGSGRSSSTAATSSSPPPLAAAASRCWRRTTRGPSETCWATSWWWTTRGTREPSAR